MKTWFKDDRDWFFAARFGMFIHWGIYAVPAWHEQHIFRQSLSRAEYTPIMQQFNPEKYDPNHWLDLAEQAGMKYICFTSKHIDGFCMWDTKFTDFNIMNTPYKKDILRQLSDCCHKRNMPLCIYYSIADMNHKNYPNSGKSYELPQPEPGDQPDLEKYLEFVKNQVTELCTNYGEIHGFWWDANMLDIADAPSFNKIIRKLQPKAVINNRGFDKGDFGTPEREFHSAEGTEHSDHYTEPIEACNSIGAESWGYRQNEDYFSDLYLIRQIDTHMAKGGNYLLNVGPKADGTIPSEAKQILTNIGSWYNSVREAFTDTSPDTTVLPGKGILITRKDQTLYLHLNQQHSTTGLRLDPIDKLPRKVILLNNNMPLNASLDFMPSLHQTKKKCLHITGLPVNQMSNTVMVIKLEFDRL